MRVDAGIIGGTGIGEAIRGLGGEALHVPTPAGVQRGRLLHIGDRLVFAMPRHSAGHRVPPHRVNYAAMALALVRLGAFRCFATAAVGSLRKDWNCGTLVSCRDFVDASGRFPTLYDRTVVHTDFSVPFAGHDAILEAAGRLDAVVESGGVYVCGNGPRYETPAEIRAYAELGGDLVGMTAATEAILMREAGIEYGCLAIVTNLACGIGDRPLAHDEVVEQMDRVGDLALSVIIEAATA